MERKTTDKRLGLVLEGGGMRCLFTSAILDVMMENGLTVDGAIGVSAGAAFGCNLKSGQKGRVLRYNSQFVTDDRYISWKTWLKTGNLMEPEFVYHTVPMEYDVFDGDAFVRNPMEFWLVCTDVITGQPVYHRMEKVDDEELEWIRATTSLPIVSKIVNIDNYQLLDGGISDSIPLQFFQQKGYERNLVILTRPRDYLKTQTKLMPFVRLGLRNHPAVVRAMEERPEMYNKQLAFVREQEMSGNTLVLAPDEPLDIADVSRNPDELKRVYDIGLDYALRHLDEIKRFIQG